MIAANDHRALSDAVRRVERRTGGQVLSAERVQYDGRDVNRVKVVDDRGRVRVYMGRPAAAARPSAAQPQPPAATTTERDSGCVKPDEAGVYTRRRRLND